LKLKEERLIYIHPWVSLRRILSVKEDKWYNSLMPRKRVSRKVKKDA